jgi:hypothetical protein
MFSKRYWKDSLERIVSSFAGAFLASWSLTHNWQLIGGFTGVIVLYTTLKCLAASAVGDADSASVLKLEES